MDLDGDGFDLTGSPTGVTFNLNNIGGNEKLAWTSAASDDAWRVLDRNGNGTIDDGTELFGDVTPQPSSREKNGFRALDEYDKPAHGGNADGRIAHADAIFSPLGLWQDANHNGISEAAEVKTLSGISSLELDYKESRKSDTHGNRFKYRAKVRTVKVSRWGAGPGMFSWLRLFHSIFCSLRC